MGVIIGGLNEHLNDEKEKTGQEIRINQREDLT